MIGWIKLHRKLLENPIFSKEGLLQMFLYCLLRANHADTKIIFNGKEEVVKKGSFLTGRKVIAADLKQSESAVYRRLKVLENLGMICIKSNNKFSIISVQNYSVYQEKDCESEQRANNERTTSEQRANTDNNAKNVKNEKNNIIAAYSDNKKLQTAIWNFLDMRNSIKAPMTDNALELMLKKLTKLGSTDDERISMLEQSVMNGYKGVFTVKQESKQPKSYYSKIER